MSSIVYNDQGRPLLYVPDYFYGQATRLLKYVNAATTSDPDLRRHICAREPLIFALVYLPHLLTSEETGGKYSLNGLHIYLAEHAATYWPFPLKPKECRCACVAPRDSGKTTWGFRILPLWGGAYGWRRYQVFLADSGDRAKQHLGNLKHELRTNEKLRADFPDLCEPRKVRGRVAGDNAEVFRSASGITFMARGLDAKNLGLNELGARPELIVVDDGEPIGRYSNASREQRLKVIIHGVLPMNLSAAVYIIGTVVRYGSIMHEVVQAATGGGHAKWITQEKFSTKYWPAYYIRKDTREPESFWPEKWPIDFILENVGFDSFQLDFMNQPAMAGAGLWRSAELHYGCPFMIHEYVLAIDPATTSKETSDETGIAVIGFDAAGLQAYIEYAKGVRLPPDRFRELVRLLLETYPRINTVIVESNQGGDWVTKQIREVVPNHIRFLTPHESVSKPERIRQLHEWCQRKWVFLNPAVHAAVAQMLSYPDVDHDDIVDAIAKGCHHKLQHRQPARAR